MTLTRRSWLRVTTTAAAAMVPAFTLGAEGAQALPAVTVHKDPSCGCCSLWIGHMERAGFRVTATDTTNMPALHAKLGVPAHVQSCHTAVVDGYLVEGHVPADEVKRLLKSRPAVKGIAVPGMPLGSPGMEQGNVKHQYSVLTFDEAGRTTVFARY
ncbi:MAG: hypothetical protein ABS36_04390 [Acidobacteria bacterium SCN 69-37]|nr:MAG: hypothetical protein ABS36_04390 [Acidobacteria bacterium SCN 69-37]